jgi:TonB family protein
VVLALVVWDKVAPKLPWASPVPAETPVPIPAVVATSTPEPTPDPEPAPIVVVEPTATPTPTETPTPEPTPTPTEVPTPTVPPALPQGAIPPVRSSDVRPVFDEELMRRHAGLSGQVELEVLVTADGRVESIRVVRGVAPEVDAVVAEAAREQLAYSPATFRGKPIAARSRVVVGVRFLVAPR